MPGVTSRQDMNGYKDFENGHLRTSSYVANGYDPYRRDDFSEYNSPRRTVRAPEYGESGFFPESVPLTGGRSDILPMSARSQALSGQSLRDGYGRSARHNGVDNDFELNSLDGGMRDGSEPTFEVDHLATYSNKSGMTNPEDGLVKLKQMENSTGIWTMRCLLIVERRHLVVIDKGNGDELERFPLAQIHEPTAILKNDRREVYNNLILFTVLDDPRSKHTASDMHIFQSVDAPAHEIVDRVLAACGPAVGGRKNFGKQIPPPPTGPAPEPPNNYGKLSDTRLRDTRLRESSRFAESHTVEARSETGRYNERMDESPLRDTRYGDSRLAETGPTYDTRITETNRLSDSRYDHLGETNRFNDASRWINASYLGGSNYSRGQSASPERRNVSPVRDISPVRADFIRDISPVRGTSATRGSTRSVRTVDHPGIPDDFRNQYSRSETWEKEYRKYNDSTPKQGYPSGTWNGRNAESEYGYNTTGGRGKGGKKGKKWYHFGMKHNVQKSKSGKENKGYKSDYDFPSTTLPLPQPSSDSHYASITRRRFKSDGDLLEADRMSAAGSPGRGGGFGATTGGYGATAGEFRASFLHRDDMDTGQNEALERDVQLLNSCFDDIEKFVARLQQAAEAYKELERRRNERGHKHKRRSQGDGMLTMRARPPPAHDFVDIFQKFKFAFNLLAKLKAHIHDPNAPELVHFLFTPLSLIYEASRDPIHNGEDLAGRAVAPLLILEAKQLLLNCLTSKELELWQHLGKPWTLVKEEWRGFVPPYNPRFYNGWQPSPQVIESVNQPIITTTQNIDNEPLRTTVVDERRGFGGDYGMSRDRDLRQTRDRDRDYGAYNDNPYSRSERRPPSPSPPMNTSMNHERRPPREPVPVPIATPPTRAEENTRYAQELKAQGAVIYEAVHDRQGKNPKELNIGKGDILQVLDKTRNWWRLRNYKGEMGYAPYTILKEFTREDYDAGRERRQSGDYSSYINGSHPVPPVPAPPPVMGSSRAGRGDSYNKHQRPSSPPPAQPPKPERPSPPGSDKKYSDELRTELRLKINGHSPQPDRRASGNSWGQPPSPNYRTATPPGPSPVGRAPEHNRVLNITQDSSAKEVRDWLYTKGFSQRCIGLLEGYTGLDVFDLQKRELERLLGKDEGKYLDSLLMVQKSNSGYKTRSAAELRAILQRRKERADIHDSEEAQLGRAPVFSVETPPDYSSGADDSSDDYGDAGKTLRNLLERQRKKIQSGYYREHNSQYDH